MFMMHLNPSIKKSERERSDKKDFRIYLNREQGALKTQKNQSTFVMETHIELLYPPYSCIIHTPTIYQNIA